MNPPSLLVVFNKQRGIPWRRALRGEGRRLVRELWQGAGTGRLGVGRAGDDAGDGGGGGDASGGDDSGQGEGGGGGNGGSRLVAEQEMDAAGSPAPCRTGDTANHLSMGVAGEVSLVLPTSGGGWVWGRNRQSFPVPTNSYAYEGSGLGLNISFSLQSVWAWGSGPWDGSFYSVNGGLGPLVASVFWSPEGGWRGVTFGAGWTPLPFPQFSVEETHYTCTSSQ
jgi:hypothetical protein